MRNKPSKNIKKGGISGIIAGISVPLAALIIEALNLSVEYEAPIAGLITAVAIAIWDAIKHNR